LGGGEVRQALFQRARGKGIGRQDSYQDAPKQPNPINVKDLKHDFTSTNMIQT